MKLVQHFDLIAGMYRTHCTHYIHPYAGDIKFLSVLMKKRQNFIYSYTMGFYEDVWTIHYSIYLDWLTYNSLI